MCREQAALWLTSRPQKLSNPLAQTVLFRRSSTADRPRATSINFFLPSATFVRQVGSRRDCLSCDVSVKHLQCRVWKANSLSFLWLQSRTTCRVYLRSSGCFLVLSSTTKQQQRNSQIHCNVLKKLPPHIWISPGEEITSLQDAAERRMWINDNRQLNLISTILYTWTCSSHIPVGYISARDRCFVDTACLCLAESSTLFPSAHDDLTVSDWCTCSSGADDSEPLRAAASHVAFKTRKSRPAVAVFVMKIKAPNCNVSAGFQMKPLK